LKDDTLPLGTLTRIVPPKPQPLLVNCPDKFVSVSVIVVPPSGSIVPVSVLFPSARTVLDKVSIPQSMIAVAQRAFVFEFVLKSRIVISFPGLPKQSLSRSEYFSRRQQGESSDRATDP
jgi:hypothetical protein